MRISLFIILILSDLFDELQLIYQINQFGVALKFSVPPPRNKT